MQDVDTKEELAEATIAARQAHTESLALLRMLDSSDTEILVAALDRVLDGGGVAIAYMVPFRAWRAS